MLQVLKGNLDTDRLELIVPGGRIGLDDQHDIHNPMSLFLENHYVFLLKECTYRYLKKNHSYYQLFKNNIHICLNIILLNIGSSLLWLLYFWF